MKTRFAPAVLLFVCALFAPSAYATDTLDLQKKPVTDEMMKAFKLVECYGLNLSDTLVTDAALDHIADMRNLQYVYLNNTAVTDAGLAKLAKLQHLRVVDVSGTKVTGSGFKYLAGLQALGTVMVNNCQVTDAGLNDIVACSNIRILELNDTKITDSGLAALGNIPYLWHVSLKNTDIGDSGITTLCTNNIYIQRLWLLNTRVDASGLAYVANLSGLDYIQVSWKKLSAAAQNVLRMKNKQNNTIVDGGDSYVTFP